MGPPRLEPGADGLGPRRQSITIHHVSLRRLGLWIGVQSEWKVLSNGVSEQIKEPSNIFSHPIYTTLHFSLNSIEKTYVSVLNYLDAELDIDEQEIKYFHEASRINLDKLNRSVATFAQFTLSVQYSAF